MCNGLNYTKLNRRLTDIKSDWEKLVGKCILHTNINIIHIYDTMNRRCTTTLAPAHSHIQWKPHYPVTTSSSGSSRGGKITLRCCCSSSISPGPNFHRHTFSPSRLKFKAAPNWIFPIRFKLITQYLFPFTQLHSRTVGDSLCVDVFVPPPHSKLIHAQNENNPSIVRQWNANNIYFVSVAVTGKCAPLQTHSRPASPTLNQGELNYNSLWACSSVHSIEELSWNIRSLCYWLRCTDTEPSLSICVFTCWCHTIHPPG